MESIQVTIKNLPYTTARNLSKLCGKIISTKFVLGNIAQLKTRNIYKIIQAELTGTNAFDYAKTTRLFKKSSFGEII